jgi:hypothetical protein
MAGTTECSESDKNMSTFLRNQQLPTPSTRLMFNGRVISYRQPRMPERIPEVQQKVLARLVRFRRDVLEATALLARRS